MQTLIRLLRFVRPYWLATLTTVLLILVVTGLRITPAYLTKLVIDDAIGQGDINLALRYVLLLVAASILTNGITAVQTYLEQFVGQRVIYDLRNALYSHVQSQSMSFFDANQSGQLMSRVTNDVNQVQFFLTQGLSRLTTTGVMIVFHLVALAVLDLPLTIVALLVSPVVVYYQRRMHGLMPMYRRVMEKMADLNVVIQENVSGIKLVKAYTREPYEAERFNVINRDIRERRLTISRMMAFVMPGQEFAGQLSTIIVLVAGASRVMSGSMTIGELVAFNSLLLMMWMPMRFIGFINQMAQQAVASGERVFEILDTQFEVTEHPDAIELEHFAGRVEFRAVSFAYGKNPPLLRDIGFVIEPGQTLALVGASGSGKSTLINLIPRFYDVTAGAVLADGHDVRDVQLKSLRSQIGMVMQETFLFNATIRENICYGREDATPAEMERAASAANAHEFITEQTDGYNALVGEHGVRLSGGQRQRLAIARALLVDPRILILDEATSSVDTQTDFIIQRALDGLMEGRTTIVIAHRLSTVQRADTILVLEDGRIVGRGNHRELLETNEHYRRIHDLQFRIQYEAAAAANGDRPALAGARSNGGAATNRRRTGQGANEEVPR